MYSRETVDKTRLFKFYLKAMANSTTHFHLLQHFISDLNVHISTYGSNIAHPKHFFHFHFFPGIERSELTCRGVLEHSVLLYVRTFTPHLLSLFSPEQVTNLTANFTHN